MRTLIISFLFLCPLAVSSVEAQPKIREVFLAMPDSLLPYLTMNSRLDFIDFKDSGMKAVVNNELGGKSEMLTLNDDFLAIQLNESAKMQLRMMPVTEMTDSCQQVVCIITTVGNDAPESKVELYSVRWHPVSLTGHLSLPADPYVAEFTDDPSLGLSLRQSNQLDAIAHEEQKMDAPWLKFIAWRP